MEGKVALITGAARGLGRAFAERLLDQGAKVCIVDINTEVGSKTELELQNKYSKDRVFFMKCDVTQKSHLEDTIKQTLKKFGQLDLMCNNAGISNEKLWEQTLGINLSAVIQGTMLGIKYMSPPAGNGGHIINVASMAGVLPMNFGPVYSASKHGVVGFTRSFGGYSRKEHKVRVNCLCPSYTRTEILQFEDEKSLGNPEDIKKLLQVIGIMEPKEVADAFMEMVSSERMTASVVTVTPHGIKTIGMPRTPEELFEVSSKLNKL